MLHCEGHAVEANLYPGTFDDGTLGGILDQHRIGVIDMGVDLQGTIEFRQSAQTAIAPRDRQVIHFVGSPFANAQRDQLIIGPEGPIEKQEIGFGQAPE
jgi:hypothetical protein